MKRPHHKVADEELQAIYKEVVADQIEAIRRRIATSKSRSGSRTRPGSASRGR